MHSKLVPSPQEARLEMPRIAAVTFRKRVRWCGGRTGGARAGQKLWKKRIGIPSQIVCGTSCFHLGKKKSTGKRRRHSQKTNDGGGGGGGGAGGATFLFEGLLPRSHRHRIWMLLSSPLPRHGGGGQFQKPLSSEIHEPSALLFGKRGCLAPFGFGTAGSVGPESNVLTLISSSHRCVFFFLYLLLRCHYPKSHCMLTRRGRRGMEFFRCVAVVGDRMTRWWSPAPLGTLAKLFCSKSEQALFRSSRQLTRRRQRPGSWGASKTASQKHYWRYRSF